MNLDELRTYKPQILAIAKQYGVSDIRVFGSVARGDADEDSDVDFWVKWSKPSFDNLYYCKSALESLLAHKVDLVDIDLIRNPLRKKYMLEHVSDL